MLDEIESFVQRWQRDVLVLFRLVFTVGVVSSRALKQGMEVGAKFSM